MLVPRKITTPKNESDLHFFLKQVAVALLVQRFDCRLVATEVYLPNISREELKKWRNLYISILTAITA